MKWAHVLLLGSCLLLDGRNLMRVEKESLSLMSRGLGRVWNSDV